MKTKIILFIMIFSFLFGSYAFPENVTLDMVESVCNSQIAIMDGILQERTGDQDINGFSIIDIIEVKDQNQEEIVAYIANLSPQGYIAVSVDTNIRPIIAYSLNNNFNPKESPNNIFLHLLRGDMQNRREALRLSLLNQNYLNENLDLWTDYINGASVLIDQGIMATQWPPDRDGWVTTEWGQGTTAANGQYNDSCPDDPNTSPGTNTDDGRCVSGCVATAAGQILNFWQYPTSITFTASDDYTSVYDPGDGYGSRSIAITATDANMASIGYNGRNPSNQTIADLLFACGVAVDMLYTDYASGAYDIYIAPSFTNHFGYGTATLRYVSSYGAFYTDLQNDMKNSRPAMLLITQSGYNGHAIVCDGYKASGEYHLNFGWDGSSDGWYTLPDGMPAWYDTVDGAVMNINPSDSTNPTWYLAEGSTNGFDQWVLIQNPGSTTASVAVTFMKPDGTTVGETVSVSGTTRYSINANSIISDESISTKLESINGVDIIAERAMYWDVNGQEWAGGHCSCGVTATATTWYLAEGATTGTFDEWVLIQNPNASAAAVTVTFMKGDGTTVVQNITVPATGRYTIHVNDFVPNEDVSTQIVSNVGVIAERAMYWDVNGMEWYGGHCSVGVTSTATTWYLAEGATSGSFDEYVLIQNPNASAATVAVTFMKGDGSTVVQNITVPATSRYTIHVNDFVPNEDVSTRVVSDIGVIAERAMYWDVDSMEWAGGHCSAGVTATATTWYLAEGATSGSFDEYVLIQNPNASAAAVTVTFMKTDGTTVVQNITVPATGRYTIHVNDFVSNDSVSTKVESTNSVGVIAERAMYWDVDGQEWAGGHCSKGVVL